jgi:integrase
LRGYGTVDQDDQRKRKEEVRSECDYKRKEGGHMAILAECPTCKTKQSVKNKKCPSCGKSMDNAKKASRVRYWIRYRVGVHQKTELVKGEDVSPYSIEDAKAMHSKRVVQRKEGKIFDVKEDTKRTFREFSDWYLDLEDVKSASSYRIIRIRLENLNKEIGHKIVSQIEPNDLADYRAKREKQGKSDSYIDDEIGSGKAVINRAFQNGKVGIDTYRKWRSVKRLLSRGDNARNRHITTAEYEKLKAKASPHLKDILTALYWTGLRENDVLSLTWSQVDMKNRLIRFEVKRRRTQKPKPAEIFIVDELFVVLSRHNKRLRNVEEDDHVFHFRGGPIKIVKTAFRKACEKAKIPYGHKAMNGVVPHDFRHTSITDMRRAGVDPLVNRAWHGHSIRDAHGGYHTIDLEDLKRAGEILESYRKEQKASGGKNVTPEPDAKASSMENVTQFVTQILF